MRDEEAMKTNACVYALVLDICIEEYMGHGIDGEEKHKAIEAYKEIEAKKARENKKYHMYQY